MKSFVELLTVCAILPICLAGQGDPERHSLYYVYTALSKAVNAPGIFEFTAMGLLDERKIDYYDSKHQVKVPQQDWMREKLPADYWEKGTQSRKSKEQWFKVNVNILMERMRQNQSDVHVLMWKHGCEADKMTDGSFKFVRGVDAYSYDSHDFLSFDDASMQWVAPVTEAVPTKQKWDGVPILNQYTKGYLEKECVDWLKTFSEYGVKAVAKMMGDSPPEVRLFAKRNGSPDTFHLTCMATGFYPKEIDITILKGEEPVKRGHIRDVLPNGDGTHQIKLSVTAQRSDINNYGCVVNHRTLEGPIKTVWELDGEYFDYTPSFLTGGIVAAIVGVLILLGILGGLAFYKGIIVYEDGRLKLRLGRQPPAEPRPAAAAGAAAEALLLDNGHGPPPVMASVPPPVERPLQVKGGDNADSGKGSSSGSSDGSSNSSNENVSKQANADSCQGSSSGSSDGSSNSSNENVSKQGKTVSIDSGIGSSARVEQSINIAET
ncbi:class I histocompatibility antigen, F10 alpha chain-like isoform X2 [Sardina pilchardus]|uniref:class I histocompatibility antigen, F10 alpha chain-like isoform X2 n=1 Tax=Sardina pilchardus TaxID=27697 RepID=UPI002E101525